MGGISRRGFSAALGLGSLAISGAPRLSGKAQPRVVVVGGGAGGATVARYLSRDAGAALDITLVESSPLYTSCFFSNLFLGGLRDLSSITHSYDSVAGLQGLRVIAERASNVDRDAREVILGSGERLKYDRLVLSPGIDIVYESLAGYSPEAAEIAPHAWQGGAQSDLLKRKFDALDDGQNIVIVSPPNPYRCPPGPYERASMMAHALMHKGFADSTITILDAKPSFAKQALFADGWERFYPGRIEWLPPDIHGGIHAVDAVRGLVETDFDTFEGALLNIIPAQRAARIAVAAGLSDATGFCPVEAASMRSAFDRNVYVIGDSCIAGPMPKSAFAANSQARVVALDILADLLNRPAYAAEYANTCWSIIAPGDSVKVGGLYKPGDDGSMTEFDSFISDIDEPDALRRSSYDESFAWYDAIIADMFG